MSLFRDGFKLEKKSDGYMNLQDGDNKIRILSQFIDGWEEWREVDGKRKPFRYQQKPEDAGDCKQFVAAIVWNYNEKKIQVLELVQTSVIRALADLAEDEDWGPVWFYDIKITRSGKDKMTRYTVNPLPRKPLATEVEKAFKERPINLDALFNGEDPFALTSNRTKGIFMESDASMNIVVMNEEKKISDEHIQELLVLIDNDHDFMKEFRIRLERAFGSSNLNDIPLSQFFKVKESVLEYQRKKAV